MSFADKVAHSCYLIELDHLQQFIRRGKPRGMYPEWEIKEKVAQYRPDQVLPSEIRLSQGEFWTVSDMQVAVKRWFGVEYTCADSYRTLLYEAGLSYQRAEGVYRSKPSQTAIADFEAELEKK